MVHYSFLWKLHHATFWIVILWRLPSSSSYNSVKLLSFLRFWEFAMQTSLYTKMLDRNFVDFNQKMISANLRFPRDMWNAVCPGEAVWCNMRGTCHHNWNPIRWNELFWWERKRLLQFWEVAELLLQNLISRNFRRDVRALRITRGNESYCRFSFLGIFRYDVHAFGIKPDLDLKLLWILDVDIELWN